MSNIIFLLSSIRLKMNVNEMESGWGGGGARPPSDYENTGLGGEEEL